MIDEQLLKDAFADLADCIELPDGAAEAILRQAQPESDSTGTDPEDEPDTGRARRISELVAGRPATRYVASHRRLAVVAAAAVVIVAAIGAVSLSGITRHASQKPSSVAAPLTRAQEMERALLPAPAHSASGSSSSAGVAEPSTTVTFGAARSGSAALGAPANSSEAAQAPEASAAESPGQTAAPLPSGEVGVNQAIEKTGSVALTVKRTYFDSVMDQLTTMAVGTGGFVQASQTDETSGYPTGTITLEVPVGDFETVLNQVRSLGKVDSVSTQAQNETGQAVDLQSQITALQDSLSQYEKILSQAQSIGDILSVQSQIDSIQSQIQQLQGQQNLLNAVTAYSTLAVSLSTVPSKGHVPPPVHPATGLSKAWHDALSSFTAAFDGLVSVLGAILFALLCVVALVVVVRIAWRTARRLMI